MASNDINADRGSTWRKWDLHIHTPASHLNNQFGSDWDVYVQSLFRTAIERDISVIGLTDYFTIDGYKKVKQNYIASIDALKNIFSQEEIKKISNIRIFPNIEFRLNKIVGRSRVNAHIIFSDELSIRDIEENFLHDLEFTYEAEPQNTSRKLKLKIENLRELGQRLIQEQVSFSGKTDIYVGMMNAVVDDDQIAERLDDPRFRDKFLFCVVADEDLPRISWGSQDHLTRQVLLQRSDALFSGNPKTREWALARPPYTDGEAHFVREFMGLKPCIHGSDAHAFSEIGLPCALRGTSGHTCDVSRPGDCQLRYCWIKADTTFEGLRQIILEPSDRAFIGPTAPDYHDQARVISSVTISNGGEWFADVEIPLNPGMVSIIGQKGSGKSALADLIAYSAGSWIQDDENCFLNRAAPHLDGMSVTLHWADGQQTTEIVGHTQSSVSLVRYLSQDYVERICARDGITRELVREIEKVIFAYLDPVDTLNASDFAELRAMKTAGVAAESERLRGVVSGIIRDEFALRDLVGKLSEKNVRLAGLRSERDGLVKQLPPPSSPEEAKLHQEIQAVRDALTKAQKDAAAEKQNLQRLADIRMRVDAFGAQVDAYFEEIKSSLLEAGVPSSDWPAFRPEFSLDYKKPLEIRASQVRQNLANIEGDGPGAPSPKTIKGLNSRIAGLLLKDSADKARQERTKQIQTRISEINAEIGRLEGEINNINDVEKPRLNGINLKRLSAYYDYFANLSIEKDVLQSLYEPIKDRLNEKALLTGRDLEFVIRWTADIKGWLRRGEVLFDQRRTGPYGTFDELSQAARKILLPAWVSGDAKAIRDALDQFLGGFRRTELHTSEYLRSNVTSKDLLTWLFEVDHIRLDYGLKFNGAELESLSPGTKGIVLLILYLGMDVGDTRPLIVDQPDENLDNESIYNLLTPYFRFAKVRRQVIVITHNPNLVVNSDSEQVIVAKAEKQPSGLPVIHYSSGALDNKKIRQMVCNILEGGDDAFVKRERRYSIVRRARTTGEQSENSGLH